MKLQYQEFACESASTPVGDVVLLHGLFGMSDNLKPLAKSLAAQFRVFALDLRNHGRSPHSDTMTLAQMAQDVFEFIGDQQLVSVLLLGHSLGAKVAMQLAAQQPQFVQALVIADIAPVEYADHHSAVFAGLNAVDLKSLSTRGEADAVLAATIVEAGVRQFLLKNLYKKNLDNAPDVFAWRFNLEALQDNYASLRKAPDLIAPFAGPVLVIKGEHSDYILAEHQAAFEQRFSALTFKMIQGTGHWLHAEKPAVFNRLVENFFVSARQT